MKTKGICRVCDQQIFIWQLAKSLAGKPILDFHTFEGKECKGSYKTPASACKAYRDFVKAFTPNKHGEYA